MGAQMNSAETQQLGHTQMFGLEIKNGSSAKDGAPERLRFTIVSPPHHGGAIPAPYREVG